MVARHNLKPIVSNLAMDSTAAIKQDIKRLMVENLMLQVGPEEIGDDQPLFGPGSIGLDSVDALQLVVALDKTYGLKIADPEAARHILQNVSTMTAAVAKHQDSLQSKP
jgi:acyl carrier protein